MRRPFGTGWRDNSIATSKSSVTVLVRITPDWWNNASTKASDDASAPVCDAAARAPMADRPDFNAWKRAYWMDRAKEWQ